MEIKFNVKDYTDKLSFASSVVNSKNSIQILDEIKFEAHMFESKVRMTGSDSEIWISVETNVISVDEDYDFCLNANDLLKALKNLDNIETTTMTLDKDKKIAVFNYGNGKFSIPYNDAQEYPSPLIGNTDLKMVTIPSQNICRAINRVLFSVANDQLRPFLNGVHFDFLDSGMVTVATDGQKLTKYVDSSVTVAEQFDFTLQTKASNILRNILNGEGGDVKMTTDGKSLTVDGGWVTMVAILPIGRYPNYNFVIPSAAPITSAISKNDIVSALKRVAPMGNSNSELVLLNFDNNKVTISAEDLDYSKSAKETCECVYDASPMKIGFKGSSLMQVVNSCESDNITIELTDPTRSGVFHDGNRDEYLSLLMPMMID